MADRDSCDDLRSALFRLYRVQRLLAIVSFQHVGVFTAFLRAWRLHGLGCENFTSKDGGRAFEVFGMLALISLVPHSQKSAEVLLVKKRTTKDVPFVRSAYSIEDEERSTKQRERFVDHVFRPDRTSNEHRIRKSDFLATRGR